MKGGEEKMKKNENPNRPKGRGILLVRIFNVANTLEWFFNPTTSRGGVFATNKKVKTVEMLGSGKHDLSSSPRILPGKILNNSFPHKTILVLL
ncbi:MAG: hypothetical protein AABX13_01925 [Nanoarchaeota archaeon]